ncbi:MAG: acyl-CoA dehydrogenase family protein [Variovorax sp.]|nr:acyl-CoA dehydrogenase family protein [Variovorax sp.]
MNIELSEEHLNFRKEVREFIESRLPEETRDRLRRGLAATKQDTVTFQRILNERGWAAPLWPKRYGGAELGQVERLILLDEIFRASAPLPQVFNITMLGPVLLKFGSEEQCSFFLPKLLNLDLWFCQGFSEPEAGSDLASLRTKAQREGDHYVVNGQKIWTTSAHHADWILCLVRTSSESRKQDGISFLLIDLKQPGITVRPIRSIDGMHHLNEVFFDNVRVPVSNLVGEEGRGWSYAKFLLSNERTGIANVGLCRERWGYAIHIASKHWRDDEPLLNHPGVRKELALLDAEIRSLELTNWRLLLAPETCSAPDAFASVLKLKGSELQQRVLALLARLAGTDGLRAASGSLEGVDDWAAPLTSRYFFSRAATIYGGASEVQKDILSKTFLG